jgi:SAM-dependent methyltransferase
MNVIWHEVECGSYEADLPLWEELIEEVDGDTLELGCGTGRVTLHLAKDSKSMVIGIDRDHDLVVALLKRAPVKADAEVADVRNFKLSSDFALVLAPMQLIQLLDGRGERIGCLSCVAKHLIPGGRAAFAIVEGLELAPVEGVAPPLPDVHQVAGWIYSSQPLDVIADSGLLVVRRLRQTVGPDGELSDEVNEIELCELSAETLESEAIEVGLRPIGRRTIPATEAHVGSTVVLLEKRA